MISPLHFLKVFFFYNKCLCLDQNLLMQITSLEFQMNGKHSFIFTIVLELRAHFECIENLSFFFSEVVVPMTEMLRKVRVILISAVLVGKCIQVCWYPRKINSSTFKVERTFLKNPWQEIELWKLYFVYSLQP